MRELRRRARALVARLRAGEGAHVLADLGEVAEDFLTSERLAMPRVLRVPLTQLGGVLGGLARAYRPAPSDVPPPPGARYDEVAAKPAEERERPSSRPPSARRKKEKKKVGPAPEEPAEAPRPPRSNGKGRERPPSARRKPRRKPT